MIDWTVQKKHTYLCVFYVTTSEVCVKATPALKKKSELLFVPFFQLSKSTFLRTETILQHFLL